MKICGESRPYTIPLPTRLVDAIKGDSKKSILEVGCGYGRACFFLHENGFRVFGVDVDRAQIRLAQEATKSRESKKRASCSTTLKTCASQILASMELRCWAFSLWLRNLRCPE
ncbi:MAG: class I SAM-dependent methyltransferase [Candidatus Bathyarchaeia archaeon]